MKDRVPVNPGRVLITPENGAAAFYATMTRADNPTQEGTPLNKNSLLKDATAALFGLGADAVPDDVLAAIKSVLNDQASDIAAGAKIQTGSYVGTGTYGASNPCSLTFDFVPQAVYLLYYKTSATSTLAGTPLWGTINANNTLRYFVYPMALNTSYGSGGFNDNPTSKSYAYGKRSDDGKTIYWYNLDSESYQLNRENYVYYYIAIG